MKKAQKFTLKSKKKTNDKQGILVDVLLLKGILDMEDIGKGCKKTHKLEK